MEKNKTCFQIENVSIFILSIFIFFYSLGTLIYAIINLLDNNKNKIIVKNGNMYIKNKKWIEKIENDYDSIYLQDDVKVNFYER